MKKLTEADAMGFLQVTPFGFKTVSQYKNDSAISIIKNIPLYTLDQITKTTRLTQSEYDELKVVKSEMNENNDLIKAIMSLPEYPKLHKHFKNDVYTFIALLNPNDSEARISIVKEKWFVRIKNKDEDIDPFIYIDIDLSFKFGIRVVKKIDAANFDTKEEAEKWTNPLTEAVLLEVD